MKILDDLNWRYAAKQMIRKEVSKEKLDTILEAIRLAPTSLGLQIFKVIVIKNQELKDRIFKEAAQRQEMIPNSSHLLVFAAKTNPSRQDIDDFAEQMSIQRSIPLDTLDGFKGAYGAFMDSLSDDKKIEWSSRQTYIAMSYATIAAANQRVDCTPVEGFDPKIVNEILDLNSQNLTATLLLPLGYRDESTDYLVNAKKIRKSFDEMFVFKN